MSRFAEDVRSGLGGASGKQLPPEYFYDELGSALFEAITVLPEYGLTRADRRVIERLAPELRGFAPVVIELGSGTGTKTRTILKNLGPERPVYVPIDQSNAALERCRSELADVAQVEPVNASYLDGLSRAVCRRKRNERMLVLFLGSTIGNFGVEARAGFLSAVRSQLQPGDGLLIGFDLVKPIPVMLAAYDDPMGVTAAFNKNVLARINRELGGEFDLRTFAHEARWSPEHSRMEMHLCSSKDQQVAIPGAGIVAGFRAGETIWTESSYKFTTEQISGLAAATGFTPERQWVDNEWPFAESLWLA